MRYMGSKRKIAKQILPLMCGSPGPWVEPFVGGANMIEHVVGRKRIGNDSCSELIAMWRALQRGWIPPVEVSREMYYAIKKEPSQYPAELVGFVSFLCSFGGKWWGGYAQDTAGNNYAERGSRCLVRQVKNLLDVEFLNKDYSELQFKEQSVIYCDPPYAGTTTYKMQFDHHRFWQWVRERSKEGHAVFVSEYTAPDDFESILRIEHKTILDKNKQKPRIEHLFRARK